MKTIRNFGTALILMMVFSSITFAQGAHKQDQHPDRTPPSQKQIEEKMDQISSELKLEGEQLKAFETAFMENHEEMGVAMKKMKEDDKEKMDKLFSSFELKMQGILNEKQFKQFKKMMHHPNRNPKR